MKGHIRLRRSEMNDNTDVIARLREVLHRGSSLALASIVEQQGSSPRHLGTKMVIDDQDHRYGTIGGSLLEARAIREAASVISQRQSRLLEFDLTSRDVQSTGMICGGRAVVLLEYVASEAKNEEFFAHFARLLEEGENFLFITLFENQGERVTELQRILLTSTAETIGDFSFEDGEIKFLRDVAGDSRDVSAAQLRDWRAIIEPVTRTRSLYVFGAGHVGRATARLAAAVGFKVAVLDDRAEYANEGRFPDAWKICVLPDYEDAFHGLQIDKDSFIIILTRGHLFDRVVLKQSLRRGAGYVGMIGSRSKRDAIYRALMAEGFSEAELRQVHSPVGLAIGAESPEEIAVSIVAELIKVRCEQPK